MLNDLFKKQISTLGPRNTVLLGRLICTCQFETFEMSSIALRHVIGLENNLDQ